MYKILNNQGLGVAGKQNELIELALTHKFGGVEVDITDLVGRHDALGKQFACQFLQSAKINMGTFCLPAKLSGTDEEFNASIAKLDTIIDLANTLNAKCCYILIEPTSDKLTFQENFEQHQSRLRQIGEKFEPHGIRVGLALQALKAKTAKGEFKFVQTAEEILTLAKTAGQANVGLCLDTWEWVVGGGTLDQIKAIDPKLITELRLGDVAAGVDLAKVTKSDRTILPGETTDSFSVAVAQALIEAGYDGAISAATALSTFASAPRDVIVAKLSKNLDKIMVGESPAVVEAPAEDAENDEAAAEEGDSADVVTAGTNES